MEEQKICIVFPKYLRQQVDSVFDSFTFKSKEHSVGQICGYSAYITSNPRGTCERFYVVDASKAAEWQDYCESRVRHAGWFCGPVTARKHVLVVDFTDPIKTRLNIIHMLLEAQDREQEYFM